MKCPNCLDSVVLIEEKYDLVGVVITKKILECKKCGYKNVRVIA